MVEHPHDFERRDWEPAKTARRFECGSPNMLGIHALEASLSLLEEIGSDTIAEKIMANSDYLIQQLSGISGFDVVTPIAPERYAGIVSFKPLDTDVQELHRRLQAAGVVCAVRGGALRFSPHFYTPREQLARALAVLDGG